MNDIDWRWLNRVGVISLNAYLILSLNFVGIFAQGPPNQRLQHSSTEDQDNSSTDANTNHPVSFHPSFSWKFSPSKSVSSEGSLSKLTPRKRREASGFRPSPSVSVSQPLNAVSFQNDEPNPVPPTNYPPVTVSEPAHNSIDLSQVTVPARPAHPVAAVTVSHLDPPKLNVRFPSHVTNEKLAENSIDRFDAYDTYDYIDDLHELQTSQSKKQVHRWRQPAPSQSLRPPRNPPKGSFQSWFNRPQPQPQHQFPYGGPPRREDSSPFLKLTNPIPYYQTSVNSIPLNNINVTPKPGIVNSILGLIGLDGSKESSPQPPVYGSDFKTSPTKINYNNLDNNYNIKNNLKEGFTDQILTFIGIKDKAAATALKGYDDYSFTGPNQYSNNHLDFDYDDYDQGQNGYVENQQLPQKPLSIGARVVKWFDGFKIPSSKNSKLKKPGSPSDRVQNSLDYSTYDTGDDHNLVFYDKPTETNSVFSEVGFNDVIDSIRRNESSIEIAKMFLSAFAALSARSDTNPYFMLWTLPTTLFAILGIVYFVGALAILAYKASSLGGANGFQLIPVAIAFTIPIILAIIFVTSRAAINGEINVNQVVRGDFRNSMRQDFDGVDFTLDAAFGASTILGIAWIASVFI